KPRIDIAAADHDADAPAAKPLRRGEHRGNTGGPGALDDQLLAFEQGYDRAFDSDVVDQQDLRDERLDDAPREAPRLLDGNALGESRGRGGRPRILAAHQAIHRRVKGRLDPDDLDLGVERLGSDRNPGNQPTAADRHYDRVEIGPIGEQLEPNRALPG